MKPKEFHSSYFCGKSNFEDDASGNFISAWKSKGLSDESIKPPAASNNSRAPALNYISTKIQVKFNGSCLRQEKGALNYKYEVNIYIASEINL